MRIILQDMSMYYKRDAGIIDRAGATRFNIRFQSGQGIRYRNTNICYADSDKTDGPGFELPFLTSKHHWGDQVAVDINQWWPYVSCSLFRGFSARYSPSAPCHEVRLRQCCFSSSQVQKPHGTLTLLWGLFLPFVLLGAWTRLPCRTRGLILRGSWGVWLNDKQE